MKLSSEKLESVLEQIDVEVIPEDHPSLPKLRDEFGDHTFFLDEDGLNIVEVIAGPQDGVEAATVVRLGSWADATHTSLATHEPEVTDVLVDVGPEK